MKAIPLFVRILLFLSAATLVTAGAIYAYQRIPSVDQQVASRSAGPAVTILSPAGGTKWFLNSTIKVRASAAGQHPIQSLELWVDGAQVQPDQPHKGTMSIWQWRLTTPGQHTLLVRAKDSSGLVGSSSAVWVTGLTSSLPGMQLVYTTQSGDTGNAIAKQYSLPLDAIKKANPAVNLDAPLPAGQALKLPIVFDQSAPPQASSAAPAPAGEVPPGNTTPPNKLKAFASQFTDSDPPGAPALVASVKDCNVSLQINGVKPGELGFYVYRLDPNANSFHKVTSVQPFADPTATVGYFDAGLHGLFSYYVTAYNGKGQTPSNIVAVDDSAPACQSNTWNGAGNGETAPQNPGLGQPTPGIYDKAYYYLSINGSLKQRVPEDPNVFLDLPNNIFNVNDQFAAIAATLPQGALALEMDAWGWKGGVLVHIGHYLRTITGTQDPPSLGTAGLLQICSLSFCDSSGLGGSYSNSALTYAYGKWPFRWQPNDSTVTSGLLQLSVIPFEPTCDASPAGLAWSNVIPKNASGVTFFFFDFAQVQNLTLFVNGWYYDSPQNFYIRVLPQVNGQTVCPASTSVKWTEQVQVVGATSTPKPVAPNPPNPYSIAISDFHPIQQPDSFYAHCVKIVVNPYPGTDPSILTNLGYDKIWTAGWAGPGATICPAPHSGGYNPPEQSFFDQLSGWVESAVSFISDAYNGLVSFITTLASTLNPLCIQAKIGAQAIGQGQTTVEDTCNAVAKVTVDAGLAFVGLPPSLPNFNDITKLSKGYLVDEAAQQFEDQTGLPCDDACKNVISQGLDDTIAQLSASQDNSSCTDQATAENAGYEPLCNPPGVQTVPDSRGQFVPAFVTVTITRDPNPQDTFPDPSLYHTTCKWIFNSTGDNTSWIGHSFALGNDPTVPGNPMIFWQGAEITGTLFHSYNQKIPLLNPGESFTVPLTLTPLTADFPSKSGFWIDLDYQVILDKNQVEQIVTTAHDDWNLLYDGALVSLNAATSCSTSASGLVTGNSPKNTDTFQQQLPSTH